MKRFRPEQEEPASPDRRKALGCLAAWSGAAVVWSIAGGVPRTVGATGTGKTAAANGFTFVQISDTHIGFHKDANPDVVGSLRRAIGEINALPSAPAFRIGLWYDANGDGIVDAGDYFGSAGPCSGSSPCSAAATINVTQVAPGFVLH